MSVWLAITRLCKGCGEAVKNRCARCQLCDSCCECGDEDYP